jgi:hypothetical protein
MCIKNCINLKKIGESRRQKAPRHCEVRSNPACHSFWIASYLAMTNALYVNALAMIQGVSSKPLAGFKTTARVLGSVITYMRMR